METRAMPGEPQSGIDWTPHIESAVSTASATAQHEQQLNRMRHDAILRRLECVDRRTRQIDDKLAQTRGVAITLAIVVVVAAFMVGG